MTAKELTIERHPRTDPNVVVYRLHGVLAHQHEAYQFLESVREDLDAAGCSVFADLSAIGRIASAGVGILAACFSSANRVGLTFGVIGVPRQVEMVLSVVGLTAVLPTFATEEEAVASMAK